MEKETVVTEEYANSMNKMINAWHEAQEYWLVNFLLNLLGYGILLVPGYFLIRFLQKMPEVERGDCKNS